jgi:osmotically-inducible protein OsmY
MGKMRREGAKRVIIEAAKLQECQPTPASTQVFNNLALASRVHAALFASPDVRGSNLEVHADGGHIHVRGRLNPGLEDELVNLVENVPGVTKVTSDLYSVSPEAFLGP